MCEPHGTKWKEKDPKESAKILYKLGLLYHKNASAKALARSSEQKRKFIQSAALLNCALVRQPIEAEQIRNDLYSLCSDIIRCAGVVQTDCNLVDYAKTLKEEVEEWRELLKEKVKRIPRIPDNQDEKYEKDLKDLEDQKIKETETCQNEITEKYKSFMRQISCFSLELLGNCPSNFALVGLGSMARKEITPYSDFENIILLKDDIQMEKDYEDVLEYFCWYAVIFHVIIINMGETILPSVNIPSLNDINTKSGDWFFDACTKRGISLDGMMPHACKLPLGRPATENKPFPMELIKPISQMANLVTKKEDLKNGYHLADILTNSCFVDGSKEIHQIFVKKVHSCSTDVQNQNNTEITAMIKEDLQNHSTKLGISSTIDNDSYNVKQFVYRSTTIFITGIAKLHKIRPGSCFEIIRRMQNCQDKTLISETFSRKLQYAVAVGCEIRLKAYLDAGQQNDYIHTSLDGTEEDISSSLIKAVGKKSCYDYFEIACCLQYDTMEILNFKQNTNYMYYHPVTMCITISSFLGMYDRIIDAWHFVKNNPILADQPNVSDNCSDIGDDEFENDVCDNELIETGDDGADNDQGMADVGVEVDNVFGDGVPEDVLEYADKTDDDRLSYKIVTDRKTAGSDDDSDKSCAVENADGECNQDLGVIAENENVFMNREQDANVKGIDGGNQTSVFSEEAENKFNILEVCDQANTTAFDAKHKVVASLHKSAERNNANCSIECSAASNTTHTKNESLLTEHTSKLAEIIETNVDDVKTHLGSWRERMQDFNCKITSSASNLSGNSELREDLVSSERVGLGKVIDILIYFGRYFHIKGVYREALDYLRIALKKLRTIEDKTKHGYNQLLCLFWIGKCNMGITEFSTAVVNFHEMLKLKDSFLSLESEAKSKAQFLEWNCFKEIAICQCKQKKFEKACKNFQKASDGYNSLDMVNDASFCLFKLGYCFLYNMTKFEEASIVFQQQLNYLAASFDESSGTSLKSKAVCYFHLGRCMLKLQRHKEAEQNFETAIQLCQSGNIEQYKVEKLTARCFFSKGIAEQKINKHEKAFHSFSKSLKLWENLFHVYRDAQYSAFMAICHENIALYHYRQKFSKTAVHHAKKALNIYAKSRKGLKKNRNLVRLNQRLGDIHKMLQNLDEAFGYYNTALSIHLDLTEETCSTVSARLYKFCGLCLKGLKKYDDAQTCFEKSLENNKQCLKNGGTDNLHLLRDTGFCYWNLRNYRLAEESFNEYVKAFESSDDSIQVKCNLAYVLQHISWCCKKEKKWEEAFSYCQQSLEKFKLLVKTPEYDFQITVLLKEIGVHFLCRNKFDRAKEHFEEAKNICKTLSQT